MRDFWCFLFKHHMNQHKKWRLVCLQKAKLRQDTGIYREVYLYINLIKMCDNVSQLKIISLIGNMLPVICITQGSTSIQFTKCKAKAVITNSHLLFKMAQRERAKMTNDQMSNLSSSQGNAD